MGDNGSLAKTDALSSAGANSSSLPVARVTLTADLEGVEESATLLFRQLSAEGRVVRMARELDYKGELQGDPELRSAADGLLYPVHAVFDYERGAVQYRISVKQDFGQQRLSVQINAPVEALEVAQGFLRGAGPPRAEVRRGGLSVESAVRIYEILRQQGECRLLTQGRSERVRVSLDSRGRLVPEALRLETCLEGNPVVVGMRTRTLEGYEVALECDAELYSQAASLLNGLVERADVSAGDGRDGVVDPTCREMEVSGYDWSCLGGMQALSAQLRELVELPLRHPHAFERLDLKPTKGVLLAGPPGVGKTTLGKILACQSGAAFLNISPRDIASKWYGETEAQVRAVFADATRAARSGRGAIVFIDEIDGFFVSRDGDIHEATRRALAQFMLEMDGLVPLRGVVVLGATNRPEDLDPALRRPGRFDHEIVIPLPDAAARAAIFDVHLRRKRCAPDLDRGDLVRRTRGRSGAEIAGWCNHAMFCAWKRHAATLGKDPALLSSEELAGVVLEQRDFDAASVGPKTTRRRPRAPERSKGTSSVD